MNLFQNLPKRPEKVQNSFNYLAPKIKVIKADEKNATLNIELDCNLQTGIKTVKNKNGSETKQEFYRLYTTGFNMIDCILTDEQGKQTPVKVKIEIAP